MSPSKRQLLTDYIREAYATAQRPLAFALVGLVLLGQFIDSQEVQFAAIGALGLIALETLFEIHQRMVVGQAGPRAYDEFFETTPDIVMDIQRSIDRSDQVHVRALGMSMGHAWTFLVNSLEPYSRRAGKRTRIKIEIAMLDPEWSVLAALHPAWKVRAEAHFNEIDSYITSKKSALEATGWSIDLYTYGHMPNWHGILVNETVLYQGTCTWRDGRLTGADDAYERDVADNSPSEYKAIQRYLSWFRYIEAHPVKHTSTQQ
jgi:hypothetical protein